MVSSKQILHSSSTLCLLCGGSSSSADKGGRRWSHSIKSHNPSLGSVRLVTLPHDSVTEGFCSRQISLYKRLVRPTEKLWCVWYDPRAVVWLQLQDFVEKHSFVSTYFQHTSMCFAEIPMKSLEGFGFRSQYPSTIRPIQACDLYIFLTFPTWLDRSLLVIFAKVATR